MDAFRPSIVQVCNGNDFRPIQIGSEELDLQSHRTVILGSFPEQYQARRP